MKKFFKNKYFIVSGITLLVYIIILIINGVVPFGRNAGTQIDYTQQMLPAFQWLWGVLHGDASLTYSPLFGGGGNMYGLQISGGAMIFCPVFYLIGLFPRTAVDLGFVVIFAILMLITVNIALFVFGRLFKNINKWCIMFFAVIWTVSPWLFIHSSPIVWQAAVGLLPLLLLSVRHIETHGKVTPFIAILTYCLIISFYISYMILVALAAVGLAYILMIAREKRKFAALLSFGLVFSLLLSMFAFYPGITYGLSAYRFGDGVIKEVLYKNYGSKLFPLIWAPLPIVLTAFYFIKHFREDKRNARFFATALGILCCGLVFERINAMWHSGSYYGYPHRYSFITVLTLILISLYYMNKFDWRADFKSKGDKTINIISLCVFATVTVGLLGLYVLLVRVGVFIHPVSPLSFGQTAFLLVCCAFAAFAFVLILRFPNAKVRNILVAVMSLLSVLSLTLAHLALPYSHGNISRADLLHTIDTAEFELPYRIKDKDNFWTGRWDSPNYGVTMGYPSLSVWQGAHPAAPTYAMRYLGFNEQGVWLSDSGGTILSDMLMGNRYVISTDSNLNGSVYIKIDGAEYEDGGEKIYIYEYKYKLPFVNIVDADTDIEKMFPVDIKETNVDLIATQNGLYRKFFGDTKPEIIGKLDNITVEEVPEFENMRKITVPASALNNFYLHINARINSVSETAAPPAYCLTESDFANLDMGEQYGKVGKTIGRGLFDLDIHDTDFTFYVWANDPNCFDGLYVAELSLTELATVSVDTNNYTEFRYTDTGVKLTINGQAGKKVFIPMTNLTGAAATVNGRAADVDLALNAYISIDLADGENNIEITFTPMNFKMGLLITLVTLLLLFVLFLLNRFFNLADKKWVQWIGVVIGCVIVAAVGYLVFMKPIALTIITDVFRNWFLF